MASAVGDTMGGTRPPASWSTKIEGWNKEKGAKWALSGRGLSKNAGSGDRDRGRPVGGVFGRGQAGEQADEGGFGEWPAQGGSPGGTSAPGYPRARGGR